MFFDLLHVRVSSGFVKRQVAFQASRNGKWQVAVVAWSSPPPALCQGRAVRIVKVGKLEGADAGVRDDERAAGVMTSALLLSPCLARAGSTSHVAACSSWNRRADLGSQLRVG